MDIYTYKNLLDDDFLQYLSLIFLYYELITFRTCDGNCETRIKAEDLISDSALKDTLSMYPDKKFVLSTKSIERFHYNIKDPFVKDYIQNISKKKGKGVII